MAAAGTSRSQQLQMPKGEKRQEKVSPLHEGVTSGARGTRVGSNTCRHGLGNAASGEGADGIKLFSLAKEGASCKSHRKTEQHAATGMKTSDHVRGG